MISISEEQADKIYDILVAECGANDHNDNRLSFVSLMVEDCKEYRFCGKLGFGGKFYNNHNCYVSYYPEDKTEEREAMVGVANLELEKMGVKRDD